MTKKNRLKAYEEWRKFYDDKEIEWLSLEDLRRECGRLNNSDAPSPELLLVHALHILEEQASRQAAKLGNN